MSARSALLHCLVLLAALVATPAAAGSLDRADMDTTCSPCRDFNRFANGGWIDRTPIPATESVVGSFTTLAESNRDFLRQMLDRLTRIRRARTPAEQLLVDHWGACMDSAAAERAGLTPLQPQLDAYAGIASASDVARQLGWAHAHVVGAGFVAFPGPDARNSSLTILQLMQGGLGLPDRDFYTRTDTNSVAIRAAHVANIAQALTYAGSRDAAREAGWVIGLEEKLAAASMTNVQRRDPNATYHKVSIDTLRTWTPGFDWAAYARGRGMTLPDSMNVAQPEFFRALARLVASEPLEAWRAYLRTRALLQAAPMLDQRFVDLDFAFQKRFSGQGVLAPRWKRCLRMVDEDLGDALGQAFVAERFSPEAKARALQLVDDVEAALGARIAELDWMSEPTKAAARVKLDAIRDFIGYPDLWRDYAGLSLTKRDLIGVRLAAQRWEQTRQLARLGRAPETREWRMSAPTVNAFYSPPVNSINFPAGILQPPFFSPDWDDAANYGGIGAVIGHEISHGFDDRGRQYDAQGNLRDWWQKEDADRYKERAQKVVEQFDGFSVAPGVNVNGRLTLGENIADLGGLAIAYAALQRAQQTRPGKVIDGWTPEQRFFLSYARIWRRNTRPEALVNLVRTNPHSPGEFRVNGPLANLEEFARAFGCKAGEAMVNPPEKRARIW